MQDDNRASRDREASQAAALVTRRRLLQRAGISAALLAGGGTLLAACGDSGETSSSSSTSTSTAARSSAGSDAVGQQLVELLDLPTGDPAGAGLTIPIGASIILSGPYTSFGQDHLKGLQLAVKHIKAAGGPELKLNVRDNAVTLAKGVANVREFAATKCVAQFSDGSATLGAELPGYEQFKIFALDAGGSIGGYASRPFYYMVRPVSPDQYVGAWTAYMRKAEPRARRWALLATDAGAEYNKTEIATTTKAAAEQGFEFVAEAHVPFDTSNFNAAFAKLDEAKPDVIQTALYGDQLGVMLKQYASSGLTARTIGPDYTPGARRIAGPAVGGFTFGNDWFDAADPTNDWARLFVQEYGKEYGGAVPGYHAAEYYQTAFFMWQVIRGVIEAGGDPTEPMTENYVKALEAAPAFPSVYGGGGRQLGEFAFDVETHIPESAPCMVCTVDGDGEAVPQATFDVGASAVEAL